VRFNKDNKMYGSMTQMEKRMNNYDLYAYKHSDNNNYSLVPGFNTFKKEPIKGMVKVHKKDNQLADRLRKIGFTRDVSDLSR